MRFINRLKRRKHPIVYGDRKKTSGFIHVADIVRANVLALDGPRGIGGIIDVGSGRSTTINTLADFIIALSGKSNLRPICAALKREISKIAVLTQLKLREY